MAHHAEVAHSSNGRLCNRCLLWTLAVQQRLGTKSFQAVHSSLSGRQRHLPERQGEPEAGEGVESRGQGLPYRYTCSCVAG